MYPTVILEKLTVTHVAKEFPAFYGIRRLYRIHKSPPLVPFLSRMNAIHTLVHYFHKINFNSISPPVSISSK
jgi:hypothetical protein